MNNKRGSRNAYCSHGTKSVAVTTLIDHMNTKHWADKIGVTTVIVNKLTLSDEISTITVYMLTLNVATATITVGTLTVSVATATVIVNM